MDALESIKALQSTAEQAIQIIKELRAEKAAIRQAYDQYQFFMEGYRNGSASIAEVTAAHNEFIALLS